MTQQQRKEQRWTKWRKLVWEQGRSGQSVAAFCRVRGLCAPHFFEWKKRLSQAATEQPRKFVEVTVATATGEPAGASAVIEIRLAHDRSLRVHPGFDANHLRALLAVLEGEA
jgi:hypothetical protein